MHGPLLVVLAAGMGSRYGGLKQMDPLGAGGEALLDYSVYDAQRAGFTKVIFIIRQDIEADFRDLVLRRMGAMPWELVFQELDTGIPLKVQAAAAGRTKPWGTAHALLCAEPCIDAPFLVINADDFYGRNAFQVMGAYLAAPGITHGALVPYALKKTLSSQGTVTRGVCRIDGGYLTSVDELTAIAATPDGRIINTAADGTVQVLPPETPVSMNFWGFPPTIFPALHQYVDSFLETSGADLKKECYLPMAVDTGIKTGQYQVQVLTADADWFGVTYQADRQAAKERIAALVRQGVYPAVLWRP